LSSGSSLGFSQDTRVCKCRQLELSLIFSFRLRDPLLNYAFQVPKEVKQTLKFTKCFAKGRIRKKEKSSQKNVNIHQRKQQNKKSKSRGTAFLLLFFLKTGLIV